jgi:hypothetical protein
MTPLPGEEDCFLIFGGNANGTRLGDLHRAEVGRSAAAWDRPCNHCDETCEASTVQWTPQKTAGACPPPRSGHAAVIFEQKFVVLGGENEGGLLDDWHMLNLATLTWSSVAPSLPYPVAHHCAVTLPSIVSSFCFPEPTLFVFGGRTPAPPGPEPASSQDELVEGITLLHRAPETGELTWRTRVAVRDSPEPREWAALVYDKDPSQGRRIWLFGGQSDTKGLVLLQDLHSLDISSADIRPRPQPEGLSLACGAVTGGDMVSVYGADLSGSAARVRLVTPGHVQEGGGIVEAGAIIFRTPPWPQPREGVEVHVSMDGGAFIKCRQTFAFVLPPPRPETPPPPAPHPVGLEPVCGAMSGGDEVRIYGTDLSGSAARVRLLTPGYRLIVEGAVESGDVIFRTPPWNEAKDGVQVAVSMDGGDWFTCPTTFAFSPPPPAPPPEVPPPEPPMQMTPTDPDPTPDAAAPVPEQRPSDTPPTDSGAKDRGPTWRKEGGGAIPFSYKIRREKEDAAAAAFLSPTSAATSTPTPSNSSTPKPSRPHTTATRPMPGTSSRVGAPAASSPAASSLRSLVSVAASSTRTKPSPLTISASRKGVPSPSSPSCVSAAPPPATSPKSPSAAAAQSSTASTATKSPASPAANAAGRVTVSKAAHSSGSVGGGGGGRVLGGKVAGSAAARVSSDMPKGAVKSPSSPKP